MKVTLSEKELEIIECMASGWDSNDEAGLYGKISMQMVYDLLKKLKLEIPPRLAMICEREDEYVARVTEKIGF